MNCMKSSGLLRFAFCLNFFHCYGFMEKSNARPSNSCRTSRSFAQRRFRLSLVGDRDFGVRQNLLDGEILTYAELRSCSRLTKAGAESALVRVDGSCVVPVGFLHAAPSILLSPILVKALMGVVDQEQRTT